MSQANQHGSKPEVGLSPCLAVLMCLCLAEESLQSGLLQNLGLGASTPDFTVETHTAVRSDTLGCGHSILPGCVNEVSGEFKTTGLQQCISCSWEGFIASWREKTPKHRPGDSGQGSCGAGRAHGTGHLVSSGPGRGSRMLSIYSSTGARMLHKFHSSSGPIS